MKTYVRMMSYLWPYRMRVMQVIFLSVLTAALSIGSLGAMKPLFDVLFASDEADLKVGLRALDADGNEVDGVRLKPMMPEGWRGRVGKDWRIFKNDTLVLEGFRTQREQVFPLVVKNRGSDVYEGINFDVEPVGGEWKAEVRLPEGADSIRLQPGENLTVDLAVTPVRGHSFFRGAYWQSGTPKRIADWLQATVFKNKFKALFIIAALILIATALKGLCFYKKTFWSNWLSQKSLMDIRQQLFDSLISQSVTYFDQRKSGAIISKFTNSLGQMQKGMTVLLSDILTEPLMAIGLLTLAFSINARLALIGMLIFPLNLIVIIVTGKLIKRSTHRSLRERGIMMEQLQRSIEGIRIVKAFVMEDQTRAGFATANSEAFRYDMRGARAKSLMHPIVEIFSAGFVIIFLLLGGMAVLRGEMTPGDFITFYASMVACYSPIKKVNQAAAVIQESVVGAEDVFAEIDIVPDLQDMSGAGELAPMEQGIEFKNVSFHYDRPVPVLHGIDLKISRGEFIALVGPSGAGKSTMINLLPRFYDVIEGSIEIDGIDIRTVTVESLRRQIGFVTQDPILFHDTIANNIGFGRKSVTLEQVEEAARLAHAHEFIQELPLKYDTQVGDRGVMMSGGQRQRIALARAIMRDPAILLLDEPTSSLDTTSERLIQDAMDQFVHGRTTLVIAHRLSTILHADRILVMEQGRIVEEGTHDELLAQGGRYKRLYEMQFRDQAPASASG